MKIFRIIFALLFGLFLGISIIEICYRYQFWDFYAKEFQLLNAGVSDSSAKKRVLLIGDSFTADHNGFTKSLRRNLPEYSIYNGGIPGFCPVQENFIFENRLQSVKPSLVILQLYEGNDLADFNPGLKNLNLKSLIRYSMSKIRFLGWLNYTLRGFNTLHRTDPSKQQESEFDALKYNPRERELFRSNPLWVEDQVCLNGDRKNDFERMLAIVNTMKSRCENAGIEFRIINIPYNARVSPGRMSNLQKINANFPIEGCCRNYKSIRATGSICFQTSTPLCRS